MFRLFDSVILNESLKISEEITALPGTPGTIVEILGNGKAYMVELFGNLVTCDDKGNLIKADADTPQAFPETIGVETVFPHQIQRIAKNEQVRLRLLRIMDDLSEHNLEERAKRATGEGFSLVLFQVPRMFLLMIMISYELKRDIKFFFRTKLY